LGTAFLRRYVLLGVLGQGGVSVVYHALDTVRGRSTAVKMLNPTLADDVQAQERLHREAMITARMRHPSVPRIYDYGDAPLADGTVVPYVVMEMLAGSVLTERLAGGPLPWPEAVRVAASVADVLAVAHRRGVVHRDISARNIMMTATGAKIIDFGVAVTVNVPDPGEGPFVVEPPARPSNDFAGPGQPADDVYAVGVLLYQMLTGTSPYPTADPNPPESAVRFVAPTPVLAVPGLPREVAEMCRSCMAKRPADRPDAATVALDLWAMIMPSPSDDPGPGGPAEGGPRPAPAVGPPGAGPAAAWRPGPPVPGGRAEPGPADGNRPAHGGWANADQASPDIPRQRRRPTVRPSWLGPTAGHGVVAGSR
jgi:serine/threonine-protein kinase